MRPPAEAPVFLLADSAPLFASQELFDQLRAVSRPEPRVVYIGASNGDDPQFFELCRAAMRDRTAAGCQQVVSRFAAEDRDRLAAADWIVLAGGDVERGWQVFERTGMGAAIERRRSQGAVVLGVSAGAVQLGLGAAASGGEWLETFGAVPWVIDVHDEAAEWKRLQHAVALRRSHESRSAGPGVGVPSGGAVRVGPGASGRPGLWPLPGTALYRLPADSRAGVGRV